MSVITTNLAGIRAKINESAKKAGRDPGDITLIAVTKYVTVDEMNEVLTAGVTDIGENRVQDARLKFPLLTGKATRHLIGALQTNKAKVAIETFDLIHSVDRSNLVRELARQAELLERRIRILVQVNISGELTKHGLPPEELIPVLNEIRSFPHLEPAGLMTMAPLVSNPEETRPVFRGLRDCFREAAEKLDLGSSWRYLSMGMSQDFEVAVEEGANLLRIGTAIFRKE